MHTIFSRPQRVLVKVSGEVFGGADQAVVDHKAIQKIASSLAALVQNGIQVAVVVGGGNIWRYRDNQDSPIPRHVSDHIGIAATVLNGAVLAQTLIAQGSAAVNLAAPVVHMPTISEPYTPHVGHQYMDDKHIVVCSGGTGNCYFTTDSGATIRALELGCDLLVKATKVDGVYDKDPNTHPDAVKLDELSLAEALQRGVRVMDQTALALAQENKLPIAVMHIDALDQLCTEQFPGSYVSP